MDEQSKRDKDRENIEEILREYSKRKEKAKESFNFFSEQVYKFGLIKKLYETNLPDQENLKKIFDPLSDQFEYVKKALPQIPIQNLNSSYLTTSLASTADFSMATMSVAATYSSNHLGRLIFVIQEEVSGKHEKRKEKIRSFLSQIDPALGKLYTDAWESFFSSESKQPALSFMREALKQLIFKLATQEFKDEGAWEKRVKNIAENYSRNSESKELLINSSKTFSPTIHELNKFKSGNLSVEQVVAILYQADSLLEILAESIDIGTDYKGCG